MAKDLKIALVQTSLAWEDPERNRNRFSKKLKEISEDVDLVILPEMFTTGFTMNPRNIHISEGQKTLDWMKAECAKKEIALVGSLPFYENDRYTNRLFFVHPDGTFDYYDKRHTFTLAGENEVYGSGAVKLIVDYKGFKICPMICYDLRFPVWSRNTEDYDVLIYVANWPKPRVNAWDALLKARAIENMAYCIGVNRIGTDGLNHEYSGNSATYDTLGDLMVHSQDDETLSVVLSKEHIVSNRGKLKFLEDRDKFTLLG
ncbi:amidohydrolase [Maribacter algicola]|uniref:Amidohydrolase n=1 Tax=Meishania litoralis TaxID=3434685 RepID=A0ACC7LJ79_9FLAO